jgi:acyl-CoA thioester hydrolase
MDPQFAFRHDVRVRFAETDAQSVVYHSNFLIYADVTRVEYFRTLGGANDPAHWRQDRGYDIVLVHAGCNFRSSARFDDLLTVWMRLAHIGNSSFGFEYRIVRGDTLVCEVQTTQCAIDREARTTRPLPDEFKSALRNFEASVHQKRA